MNSNTKAHLAAFAGNFIFSANYSIIKILTPALILPFGLNVARASVSVVLFWFLFVLNPGAAGIKKKHIGRFIICGFTGVAFNQMLFIKGMSLTTSIHASLLTLATPIFITFIAAWLLAEGLTIKKISGLVIGVGGAVILISMKETSGTGSNVILGDVLILLNAISYGFYMVLVRPLMKEYSPIHVLRWVFTIGSLVILPIGWNQFANAHWSDFTLNNWLQIAFVVLGATFFAYLFIIYAIRQIGSSAAGAYIYCQPVFAAIIAMIFLGEQFSWMKGVAALLIFCGVFLVSHKKPEPIAPVE